MITTMLEAMSKMRRRERGFTLIELMIVIAIMLVISGMAMPRVMNAIDDIRLRGASRDVIGLMQQARQAAIKQNAFYQMGNQGPVIFIDMNGDGAFGTYIDNSLNPPAARPEPSVQIPY